MRSQHLHKSPRLKSDQPTQDLPTPIHNDGRRNRSDIERSREPVFKIHRTRSSADGYTAGIVCCGGQANQSYRRTLRRSINDEITKLSETSLMARAWLIPALQQRRL